MLDTSRFWIITNNEISDVQAHGIQIAKASRNVLVKGNVITRANRGFVPDYGGIRLYAPEEFTGPVEIVENTISNSFNGIAVRDGGDVTGKSIKILGNALLGNLNRGVYHGGIGILEAGWNYWNSPSGPTTYRNPLGTGDAVDDLVNFTPFLVSNPN